MNSQIQIILAKIFTENVDTFQEEEAKSRVGQYIKHLKDSGFDMNFSVFVKDTSKKTWQIESHFYKVFYDEIDYAMEKYKLSQSDMDFLCRLGRYLHWELNLLVDENNIPLYQSELASKMNISIRTLQRNLKPLIDNHLVYKIEYENKNFYLVNPYLIFVGKNINIQIPHLFDTLGYIKSERSNRNNRYNKVTKRNDINNITKNIATELT